MFPYNYSWLNLYVVFSLILLESVSGGNMETLAHLYIKLATNTLFSHNGALC